MLIDGTHGTKALHKAADHPFWIGRPVEQPGSRPLEIEGGGDLGAHLIEWPVTHTVKCLCFYHPDDDDDLKARQERELACVFDACRTVGRELMIEIIAGKNGPVRPDTVAQVLERLYRLGIRPDWWKLEPQATAAAWANIDRVIDRARPALPRRRSAGPGGAGRGPCRGFRNRRDVAVVAGFAVGRTIFSDAAASGWRAKSTTRRRCPTWQRASAAWFRRGRRRLTTAAA